MNRTIVKTLLIFFTLFTVYNTLIPFNFTLGPGGLGEALSGVSWGIKYFGKERISLTDVVGNVILFMPFGFLVALYLAMRGKQAAALISAVIASFALSLFIECAQLFIPTRNSAVHDLFHNTLGGAIGAAAALFYMRFLMKTVNRLFSDLYRAQPFSLLLALLGLSQAVAAAMPLTVSITVDHLLRSIKTTNIVPFGYQSLGKLLLDRPVAEDLKPYDFTFFIENTLFWVIAGYLLKLCYDLYWRDKDYGKKLLIALPLLYFPALEAMQLIILNRITDINDVLAGYIGTAIGIAVYNATAEYRRQARNEVQWLFIPLMCYLIYILFSGFRPFDWSLESRVIEMDLLPENLIPFYAYFRVTGLSNLFDLLASLFFFLPVGLYWAYQRMAAGHDYAGTFLRTTLAGLAVGTVIELTQLFSFSRVAEVTDILAYGVGGWLGTFILYYFEKQIRPVLDAHPTSRQAPCATAPTHPDRPPR